MTRMMTLWMTLRCCGKNRQPPAETDSLFTADRLFPSNPRRLSVTPHRREDAAVAGEAAAAEEAQHVVKEPDVDAAEAQDREVEA